MNGNLIICVSFIFVCGTERPQTLESLHWLPIRFRISFKTLLFVFKALNGLAPPYLTELLLPYMPSRPADQLLLMVPKARLKLRGDRTFSVAAPRLWNELPLHVRQASS